MKKWKHIKKNLIGKEIVFIQEFQLMEMRLIYKN